MVGNGLKEHTSQRPENKQRWPESVQVRCRRSLSGTELYDRNGLDAILGPRAGGLKWHTSLGYEICHCWLTTNARTAVRDRHGALWECGLNVESLLSAIKYSVLGPPPVFWDTQGPTSSKSICLPVVITTVGRNMTWHYKGCEQEQDVGGGVLVMTVTLCRIFLKHSKK